VALGAPLDRVLLILTTIVSLEAIYLGIFIQMTVNKNTADIDEIQEDVEDIAEDVDEIQKDIDEIQEDVDEIQEDVDEIVEVSDESEPSETVRHKESHPEILEKIQHVLESLARDVEALKNKKK
jgi:methyl-accepting chemotaxis protein